MAPFPQGASSSGSSVDAAESVVDVHYDDGAVEEGVPRRLIRLAVVRPLGEFVPTSPRIKQQFSSHQHL